MEWILFNGGRRSRKTKVRSIKFLPNFFFLFFRNVRKERVVLILMKLKRVMKLFLRLLLFCCAYNAGILPRQKSHLSSLGLLSARRKASSTSGVSDVLVSGTQGERVKGYGEKLNQFPSFFRVSFVKQPRVTWLFARKKSSLLSNRVRPGYLFFAR